MGGEAQLQKIISKELKKKEKNWETIDYKIVNGKKVSLIQKKNLKERPGLPLYTDTSDIYLIADSNGEIKQMAVYDTYTRKRLKDFDWRHEHHEFKEWELHIHPDFKKSSRETRSPTENEKRELKQILKEFGYDYSKIKFDKEDNP